MGEGEGRRIPWALGTNTKFPKREEFGHYSRPRAMQIWDWAEGWQIATLVRYTYMLVTFACLNLACRFASLTTPWTKNFSASDPGSMQ